MTKRIISLILASIMLLSLTSCKKEELNYAEMTLEEYIDKVKLPENLTISIDPATVEERETVKVYENAECLRMDDSLLIDVLFKNPVTKEEIWAEGPQFWAETDTQTEILNLYDGEAAINGGNEEKEAFGGFNYRFYPTPTFEQDQPWGAVSGEQEPEMYYYGNGSQIDFFIDLFQSKDDTLSFATRDEIADAAASFFEAVGVSDVEVQHILAYDTEALQNAIENGSRHLDDVPDVQKSDETYCVLCRQLIDGIPVNTYSTKQWEDSKWGSAAMQLQYTESGLVEVMTSALLQQPAAGTETEIISAVEALECLKKYYSQGILLKPYTVESMELIYIPYRVAGEPYQVSLRPYWLLKTTYQQDYPKDTDWKGNPLEGEIKAYDFIYFDAVTGEYFEGSTSAKPYD